MEWEHLRRSCRIERKEYGGQFVIHIKRDNPRLEWGRLDVPAIMNGQWWTGRGPVEGQHFHARIWVKPVESSFMHKYG